MTPPNARERKALRDLTGEWEHRSKLGGEKTFADLITKGWIVPFRGHNPNGDRYSITDLGRAARAMPVPENVRGAPRLKELPSTRLRRLPGRFDHSND